MYCFWDFDKNGQLSGLVLRCAARAGADHETRAKADGPTELQQGVQREKKGNDQLTVVQKLPKESSGKER